MLISVIPYSKRNCIHSMQIKNRYKDSYKDETHFFSENQVRCVRLETEFKNEKSLSACKADDYFYIRTDYIHV